MWLALLVLVQCAVSLSTADSRIIQIATDIDVNSVHQVHSRNVVLAPAVERALRSKKHCVVALESTVISHGLPFPRNIELAEALEAAVIEESCVPATIYMLHGVIHVGLPEEESERRAVLELLGNSDKGVVLKLSRRDIAFAASQKLHGATTVSATMLVADWVGIEVFATGGIGGVHRHGELTLDVSADLRELGRTRVAVVCAGVKQILDIGRTLEYLETEGVPVITIGQEAFPSFYSVDSGFASPMVADDAAAAASVIAQQRALGLSAGVLVANPIPEEAALPSSVMEELIIDALQEATDLGVVGKAVTPFLLSRVAERSAGASVDANIKLLIHNAHVAGQISSFLMGAGPTKFTANSDVTARSFLDLVIIGGATIDLIAQAALPLPHGSSVPGTVRQSFGGVARNIAEAAGLLLARSNLRVDLITALGDDAAGRSVVEHLNSANVSSEYSVVLTGARTARFVGVLQADGDLHTGVADMAVLESAQDAIVAAFTKLGAAKLVVIDGNFDQDVIRDICRVASQRRSIVLFEPTSVEKAARGAEAVVAGYLDLVKPNSKELEALVSKVVDSNVTTDVDYSEDIHQAETSFELLLCNAALLLQKGVRIGVVVSRGPYGATIVAHQQSVLGAEAQRVECSSVTADAWFMHVPAPAVAKIVSTTGAGDSLTAGIVATILQRGRNVPGWLSQAVHVGMRAAGETLQSSFAASPTLKSLAKL